MYGEGEMTMTETRGRGWGSHEGSLTVSGTVFELIQSACLIGCCFAVPFLSLVVQPAHDRAQSSTDIMTALLGLVVQTGYLQLVISNVGLLYSSDVIWVGRALEC